jgi:hypothetical protein
LIENCPSSFFFTFIYMKLSQSYVHGSRVSGLTWFDSRLFFHCFF